MVDWLATPKIAGVPFLNPVGLSAGFDKNVKLVSLLPSIGFGAAEFGSITLKPYGGNPKPRLVRLPKSKGIVVFLFSTNGKFYN
jgi:dihydroorotate dehydrogenase